MHGDGGASRRGRQVAAPDDWVGKQVRLQIWTGKDSNIINVELDSVSDRGLVVKVGNEPKKSRFYPWSAVLHAQLREDEKQRSAKKG
jgi:hypothetical protein